MFKRGGIRGGLELEVKDGGQNIVAGTEYHLGPLKEDLKSSILESPVDVRKSLTGE